MTKDEAKKILTDAAGKFGNSMQNVPYLRRLLKLEEAGDKKVTAAIAALGHEPAMVVFGEELDRIHPHREAP